MRRALKVPFARSYLLFALSVLAGCIADQKSSRTAEGLSGAWQAHVPYLSAHQIYKGFLCFDADGVYQFFDASYEDTLAAERITGIQWESGTWNLIGDSLRTDITQWALFHDGMGIGNDWKSRVELKAHRDSSRSRIRIAGDSLYVYLPERTTGIRRIVLPQELINACH